jgi:hypothetical protein
MRAANFVKSAQVGREIMGFAQFAMLDGILTQHVHAKILWKCWENSLITLNEDDLYFFTFFNSIIITKIL